MKTAYPKGISGEGRRYCRECKEFFFGAWALKHKHTTFQVLFIHKGSAENGRDDLRCMFCTVYMAATEDKVGVVGLEVSHVDCIPKYFSNTVHLVEYVKPEDRDRSPVA